MRHTERASPAGAGILMVSASIAAVSGVLIAATRPLETTPFVLLPLVAGAIGVVASGFLLRRAALGGVLVLWMLIGGFVAFAATSGVMPAGLVLAISLFVTVAVYPFDDSTTRLMLIACAIGAAAALACGALRPFEDPIAQGIAVIVNAVVVLTYAIAAVRAFRTGSESRPGTT